MFDNYNYPLGADTPDAPWNQSDPEDIYGEEARERIREEIDGSDDYFIDWLLDCDYISDAFDEKQINAAAKNGLICNEYEDYRLSDMVRTLAEDEADQRDIFAEEAAEARRERRLIID